MLPKTKPASCFGEGGVRPDVWRSLQPLIRLGARLGQDGVRALPRAVDHQVGILFGRLPLGQRVVGLFPFHAQALVRLFTIYGPFIALHGFTLARPPAIVLATEEGPAVY